MNKQKHEVCETKIASVRAGHEKKLKRIHEKRERYVAEKVRRSYCSHIICYVMLLHANAIDIIQ